MTRNWRTVGLGLRLVLVGARAVGWSLAAAFAVGCGGAALLSALEVLNVAGWVVIGLVYVALGTVVLGRLLCTVGRYFCLATPPEATLARARIRLAVIFETCSLLSGAATIPMAVSGLPVPPELGLTGVGFCLLTSVLGRVSFFAFELAVSEGIGAPDATADARQMFRIALFTLGAVVLGTVLLTIGNPLIREGAIVQSLGIFFCVVGGLLLFLAVGFTLFLFTSHFILIADLRRLLAKHTPESSDDDPDREYRDRYLAGGGTDPDG